MKKELLQIISDPIYKKHLTGPGHPESPHRCDAILQALKPLGIPLQSPRAATVEEVLLCHSNAYFETVLSEVEMCRKRGIEGGNWTLKTGDVQISPGSMDAALFAAGAVLCGVEAVMERATGSVFCIVRPPGHHACSAQGMGFCLFNNVAIGARFAEKKYGVKRILIVDWDVHHGNGTEEIFYEDPTVFYFSTHQSPLYPGTGKREDIGRGKGAGYTLNCPFPGGPFSRKQVLNAFEKDLVAHMESFRPELVMISCGFDAHKDDPLGGFNLDAEDFGALTKVVKQIAETYSKGRIVSVLEGGYHLGALASSARSHVEGLL